MTDMEKQLLETIQEQSKQITRLTEQIEYLTRKRYGASLEQNVPGQTSLFDPFELPETTEEQTASVTVPSYTRKKHRRHYAESLADLPVSYRDHELSVNERQCQYCENLGG